MGFLPDTYEPPASSGGDYLKLKDKDKIRLRILSDALTGWVYWNNQKKPVRLTYHPDSTPADIQLKDGKPDTVKHFWLLTVYNYNLEKVQVWEITQKTIQNAITDYFGMEEYGHPSRYDIVVSREGSDLSTEYKVIQTIPKSPEPAVILASMDACIDLIAMLSGNSPFGCSPSESSHENFVRDGSIQSIKESIKKLGWGKEKVLADMKERYSVESQKDMNPEQLFGYSQVLSEMAGHAEKSQDYDDIPF